jgi:ribosomal-protein-alanine N-acetyltransferase
MAGHDLDAVLELAANSSQAPHWSRAVYQEILAPSGSVLRVAFVAERQQALGGFAVASWLTQESAAELESLVVDPIYRRQGAGSALLRACMRSAALAGASSMRLEVRMSNTAALALYHGQGFASTGIRRGYYSHPVEDAVLLQAPLGSSGPL